MVEAGDARIKGQTLRRRHRLARRRPSDPGTFRDALSDQRDDLRADGASVEARGDRRRADRARDGAGASTAGLGGSRAGARPGAGQGRSGSGGGGAGAHSRRRAWRSAKASRSAACGGWARRSSWISKAGRASRRAISSLRRARPAVDGLGLEKAGVAYSPRGVEVGRASADLEPADLRDRRRRRRAGRRSAIHPCRGLSRRHRHPERSVSDPGQGVDRPISPGRPTPIRSSRRSASPRRRRARRMATASA